MMTSEPILTQRGLGALGPLDGLPEAGVTRDETTSSATIVGPRGSATLRCRQVEGRRTPGVPPEGRYYRRRSLPSPTLRGGRSPSRRETTRPLVTGVVVGGVWRRRDL